MTRFALLLLIGIAACGPAIAQPGVTAMVSPALGLGDFRHPITCTGANICAMATPAWGATAWRRSSNASRANGAMRRVTRLTTALLPGPTPRPEPAGAFAMPQA